MKSKIVLSATVLSLIIACKTATFTVIKCDSEFAFTSNFSIEEDAEFLLNLVQRQIEAGNLGPNPMVVIDAIPFVKCSDGKHNELPINKTEIAEISVLEGELSVPLYGPQANDGLVLITSKSSQEKEKKE